MAFITPEELTARLKDDWNLVKRLDLPVSPENKSEIVFDESKFKVSGETRERKLYSNGLRALIAATAISDSPQKAAEIFECSEAYAQALTRGEYSKAKDPVKQEESNRKLKAEIYEELSIIRDTARVKLMAALNLINEDSLQAIPDKDKVRIAAQVANQLSGVIERTIEKSDRFSDVKEAHLHLYAPENRPMSEFTVKTINAEFVVETEK